MDAGHAVNDFLADIPDEAELTGYEIEDLAAAYLDLKDVAAAVETGLARIASVFSKRLGVRAEGSVTHHVDGFKIVLKDALNYKVDWDVWSSIEHTIPESLRPVRLRKQPLELDETGLKYLRLNEPDVFAQISQAITSTPAKLGVKVERNP